MEIYSSRDWSLVPIGSPRVTIEVVADEGRRDSKEEEEETKGNGHEAGAAGGESGEENGVTDKHKAKEERIDKNFPQTRIWSVMSREGTDSLRRLYLIYVFTK